MPRVSVLMPVFNRERFVDEAVASVIAQDFSNFELVIVDDGSTDGTAEILRSWQRRDPRVVVLTLSENQGIPAALNAGLQRARAPYVARLDSDDVIVPRRLAAQAAVLDAEPGVVLVSCAYETMDVDGRTTGTWRADEPHEVIAFLLGFYNVIGGGGQLMFRRAEALALGGFSSELPSSEDYDLWVRLLATGRIVTLPLVGMRQREHDARSIVKYGAVKRANWGAIMTRALVPILGRTPAPEEIEALITLWRRDGREGMAERADATMREAFARFRSTHADEELHRRVSRRVARQWVEAASTFRDAGNREEAARYEMLASSWDPHAVARPLRWRAMAIARRGAVRAYRILSRARPLVGVVPRTLRRSLRERLLGQRDPGGDASSPATLPPGVNVVGYTTRPTGMGESARLFRAACDSAGIPSVLIDVNAVHARHETIYRTSVFHINADQLPHVHDMLRHVFEAGDCNIGLWHWELPDFPDAFLTAAGHLDEIWAPSRFIQESLARKVTIPVLHMPHGIDVTAMDTCTPQALGVPAGRFTFLCAFDLLSLRRKNPFGAVEAFHRAFGGDDRVALLVRATQAERHPAAFAELESRLRGTPNVHVSKKVLDRPRMNGLVASCDALVSLHHSEGFGLVPAEAMALGRPVIATGWSGNMDFMDEDNSCPVRFDLAPVDDDRVSFGTGQQWAVPDLDHAAQWMRRIFEDEAFRKSVGERARTTMSERFSVAGAGRRYRARLTDLGLL